MSGTTITVENVDVALLRKQRDYLLTLRVEDHPIAVVEGLVNLLDAMLDNAEGYETPDFGNWLHEHGYVTFVPSDPLTDEFVNRLSDAERSDG
jgi:hypothetical protein